MTVRSYSLALALTGVFVLGSGCANVVSGTYLHDETLKEKTDEAHASFSAVDDQPDFFQSAAALLEQAGRERRDAQRRRLDALHELTVATLISDNDSDGVLPIWDRARESLEEELRLVSRQSLLKANEWPDQRPLLEAARAEIGISEKRVDTFSRSYKKAGGEKSVSCSAQMQPLDASETGARFYNRLVRACSVKLLAEQDLKDLLTQNGFNATVYHERRDELGQQLQAVLSARQLLQDRLGAARTAYEEESVTFEQEAVRELSEAGRKLSDMLASIDKLKLPDTPQSVLGIELPESGGIVNGKTLAESVRAAILTEELEALIRIMSDPDMTIETEVQKEAQAKYRLIVQSDTALRGIRAFRDMSFPTPQSALMLLEHYRNQSAAYDHQVGHLNQQYRLSHLSASAAERKIEHLLNALQVTGELNRDERCEATGFATYSSKCKDERTRVARILISLDQAHIQGTLPAELAFETSLNNDMLFGIEASRGHTAHVLAILRPAITTLKAYGDGGIKTETIARLMNTLSLISISVGVN